MRTLATIIVFLAVAAEASAGPTTFQVDYTVQTATQCVAFPFPGFPPCSPASVAAPPSQTFVLTSAQLLVDGPYDVSPALSPGFIELPFQPGCPFGMCLFTSSLSAMAIVSGNLLTDLTIAFSEGLSTDPRSNPLTFAYVLNASSGNWSFEKKIGPPNGLTTITAAGVYSIQQFAAVPEPASLVLVVGGLFGLWIGRRRLR